MTENAYQSLVRRNYLYIPDEVQQRIKITKLAFFGVGLSSTIVEHCVRLGFQDFYLQDNDTIELSNLNRQSFFAQEVGSLKVETVRQHMLSINPSCKVTCNSNSIQDVSDIKGIIAGSDIVINTIDCHQTYFDIIENGRTCEKLVLCPYNPGFSGFLLAFSQDSCASSEVFDLSEELNDITISKQVLDNFPQLNTLKNLGITSREFIDNVSSQGYFPQIIVGAAVSSALVLATIIEYLSGNLIKLAPDVSCLNAI